MSYLWTVSYSYTQKFKLAAINFNTGQEMEMIPSLPTFSVGEASEEQQADIDSPKCHKVYESCDSCDETIGTRKSSKYCNHIQFPEHPHQSRRTECKALLLKSVQFRSGRKVLYPFKLYCYNGIKSTLQKLLMRPNFFSNCQLWRSRPVNNLLSDLYDGQIWKESLNRVHHF